MDPDFSKHVTIGFLFLMASFIGISGWDPNAGLVQSLTKAPQARVLASSSPEQVLKANDGNDSTFWQSHGCMPGGFYLGNGLSNVLLNACQQGRCTTSSTDTSQLSQVTDDSTTTGFQVRHAGTGGAQFAISLSARDRLREITVRGVYPSPVHVLVVDGSSETEVAILTSAVNYQTHDFNVTFTPATALIFRSTADFTLHTVGALGSAGCVERLYVDMGSLKAVQVIRTRHWPGQNGLTSEVVTSVDGVTWQSLLTLDPHAVQAVVTRLANPVTVRYIGIQHTEDESSYAKVFVWEIDAYDDSGQYGALPQPVPNPVNFRTMLGVNAIWGWGWGKSSVTLSQDQGAALYAPVASYARSYHNLDWDIKDPDHIPDYDRMAQGHGTEGQSWINWDTEYQHWVAANVSVHVSVQFTAKNFPVSVWDNPRTAAFNYGQAFARHFGPTHGNGLVKSVEVGNEPWDYPADFYHTILEGMAAGFKAGDPNIIVMPGAFQAYSTEDTGNYIGTRVTADVMNHVDVINSHHYSWRRHDDGSRHATYPEDPAGSFNEVLSIVRWRNTNTPTKPLWMTEWGWDSDGGGQACTKFPECTTQLAASAYAARGLLMHARLGVARSTWFFYGNLDDCDDHVFCRSGLTSSKLTNFQRKGPFYTLQHFLELVGQTHFLSVLKEDAQAYVYVLGDATTHAPTHLVAWRAVDAVLEPSQTSVTFTIDRHPLHAWQLSMTSQQGETTLPTVHGSEWTMHVSAVPTVVALTGPGSLVG